MNDLFMNTLVEEAITRIKTAYEKTGGKIFLSFSGGKDSTVVAELLKMAQLPTDIPFVFADTGVEYNATYEFVKGFDYPNIVIVKPEKPLGVILKEYGIPVVSKEKSGFLRTFHNNIENPLTTAVGKRLVGQSDYKSAKLADKYFHLLHPNLDYKVTNSCCTYLKKKPFEKFAVENKMMGTFTGIRVAEGGIRSKTYKTCTAFRKKGNRTELVSMPIFDWSDEAVDYFITKYKVEISKAYTVYGLDRTGCAGCPYARNNKEILEILKIHEPLKYKACLKWFGKAYMDSGVELPNDEEYMKEYLKRKVVNDVRREEMLIKYGRKKVD